ncbi:MAG: hypothetical protein K2M36_05185, partial [Clostridia bacterium]|nr:hypothetical protein [Clostridia bacterium]
MLLYNLSFPRKGICDEQELYFRGGTLRDSGVFVKNGETVKFDTYFNCFSHIKYKKYTKVMSASIRLEVEGRGVACICRYVEGGEDLVLAKKTL